MERLQGVLCSLSAVIELWAGIEADAVVCLTKK